LSFSDFATERWKNEEVILRGKGRISFGHAYGGGAQFFSMWIVGSDKP